MKQNLVRNLVIGFGFSLLILLCSSVASYLSIQNLVKSAASVDHTRQVVIALDNTYTPLLNAETSQRGFLLTKQAEYLDPVHGAFQLTLSGLTRVKSLTADNSVQQDDCELLRVLVNKKFALLEELVESKKTHDNFDAATLRVGTAVMDSIRVTILRMKSRESELQTKRNEKFMDITAFAPAIIIVASVISILIASFFFARVRKDIEDKARLQEDLETRDRETARRLGIVQEIAGRIAQGDYSVRVNDDQRDALGNLSSSLNQMASGLDKSFRTISEKEWMQAGIVNLAIQTQGEQPIRQLMRQTLQAMAEYSGSAAGAFYLATNKDILEFSAGFAFDPGRNRMEIPYGKGASGQAALSKKAVSISDISPEDIQISYATGDLKPTQVIALPILFEGNLMGVIELASTKPFLDKEINYINSAAENVGIALNMARNRARVQELLEETQAQTEELQAQHKEMEVMNAEMEAQTENLQVSEEELKVQQEELMQTNQELEERSKLLEERNELIAQRNREIQKKAEELAVSTRYKSEFLANMSHELRTPLNSILLLSRLLAENKDQSLNKDQVEYAQVIQSSGNGLLELIDEILDLSKIESGRMQLEYGKVHIAQMLRNMKMLFEPVSREKKVEFRISSDDNVPEQAETDRMRVEQILKNLLSNAFKFTKAGSVDLKVSAEQLDGKPYVRFDVRDSGIGIPKDKQELIFEAFQQADGSTKRRFGGTGLGLSISRELGRLLNGDLTVRSEEGSGSVFTLRIPVDRQPDKTSSLPSPVHITPLQNASVPAPMETASAGSFEPKQVHIPEDIPDDRDAILPNDRVILIIEDDTHFAKALLEYTRGQQYKGVVAVRGDVGVQLAKKYRPRGILLDIQLPVRNGWEVMEELKRDSETRHIPVHIMSSFEARGESMSKGAIEFINKPVAFDQMNEVFKRIEAVLHQEPTKVLIVEENPKHARALSYYLGTFGVAAEISESVDDTVALLKQEKTGCVVLDLGVAEMSQYEKLQVIRDMNGTEKLTIILFTAKNFSRTEEQRVRQFVDSIVVKTAHSYQRILDEVSLFLHVVDQNKSRDSAVKEKMGTLDEVLKNKAVLLADDDVRNIFSLTKVLEQHKMKVLPAIDGKEALEILQANPQVNIVLMDMMMPEMDGYESIRKIRANPANRNLPIIAVTAKAMVGDREKCINAGASDYISKPVDIDQLISLLRIWLYEK